jgi:hypothetical protein
MLQGRHQVSSIINSDSNFTAEENKQEDEDIIVYWKEYIHLFLILENIHANVYIFLFAIFEVVL